MKKDSSETRCKIKGIITPSEWDENYSVIKVKISLSGEKEYILDTHEKGKELLTKTGQKLKGTGRLKDDGYGNKIISLDDYEVIDF